MNKIIATIFLIYFRVYLEVIVFKNPTCFSRWSVSKKDKCGEANVPGYIHYGSYKKGDEVNIRIIIKYENGVEVDKNIFEIDE